MQLEDVEVGAPGPGQVKIRHTAIGLNFIDIYTRSGLYQTPLPNAVGREAAGVIVEVGPKVKGFKKGDRVAYCGVLGAYCQERLMGVEQLVQVPEGRERRAGRGHHAEGHDDGIPRRPLRQAVAQEGRHRAVPCRRRRRRPAVRPVGQGARLQGDRHRVVAGEGRSRQEERLQVGDRLHQGERRRRGEGDHQGQGRARRVRRRRQGHLGRPRSTACSRAA